MLRAIRLFSLLLLGTGATLYSTQATAQAVKPTGLAGWDSTNQVLFFGEGSPDFLVRSYAIGDKSKVMKSPDEQDG